MTEREPSGKEIACERCNGSGIGQHACAYQPWHEECYECGGSGKNWLYPRGAIAKYYSGPLIGRATLRSIAPPETGDSGI